MRIDYIRVLLGGLLAGVIINVCEFAVSLFFREDWAQAMRSLGKSAEFTAAQMLAFHVWGLLMGIVAVWTYAAIRARFGPGPKTAVIAAVAIWIPGYFLSMVPPAVLEMFPLRLVIISVLAGLIELLLGTIAGAWVYREPVMHARAAGAA
jgi:hypothetical protein